MLQSMSLSSRITVAGKLATSVNSSLHTAILQPSLLVDAESFPLSRGMWLKKVSSSVCE